MAAWTGAPGNESTHRPQESDTHPRQAQQRRSIGAFVRRGAPLVTLDDTGEQAAIATQQANINALVKAMSEFTRAETDNRMRVHKRIREHLIKAAIRLKPWCTRQNCGTRLGPVQYSHCRKMNHSEKHHTDLLRAWPAQPVCLAGRTASRKRRRTVRRPRRSLQAISLTRSVLQQAKERIEAASLRHRKGLVGSSP
jgi:multidrug resistance efflux pump